MAEYRLIVRPSVNRDVRSIPRQTLSRIVAAIKTLPDDPLPHGASKLSGMHKTFRIRIGDYRIVYEIDSKEHVIDVVHVAHRRDVYRQR